MKPIKKKKKKKIKNQSKRYFIVDFKENLNEAKTKQKRKK